MNPIFSRHNLNATAFGLVTFSSVVASAETSKTIQMTLNEQPKQGEQSKQSKDVAANPKSLGPADFEAPFLADNFSLSDVLQSALRDNIDLRSRVVDVAVSESSILAAMGAFDVRINAGLSGSAEQHIPRGSTISFSRGASSQSANFGFSRRLETGGNIDLNVAITRRLNDQFVNPFNPTASSSTNLASYSIEPRITLTHPLLRGLGVRVNRIPIDRAKIAVNQAQAVEMQTAQELVRDLLISYWDLLFAKEDLTNKRDSVTLARQQLERTLAQVRAGRLPAVDAKSVEQSLAVRESEVIVAENTLLDSSLNLRTLMGNKLSNRPVLGIIPTTDPEIVHPQLVDAQHEIHRSYKVNPQIRQLEFALSSKRLDELEAANQRMPQLDFEGTINSRGMSTDTAAQAERGIPARRGSWGEAFQNFFNEDIRENGIWADYTVTGNLRFTWDVQNRTAKANHQRVILEIRKAELNLEKIRQTIAASVLRWSNTYRSAAKRVEVAQLSVELSEDNLAAEQARFRVGRSTNYDVLSRIDELAKSRSEALSARIELIKARIQIQVLNGELLPAYGLDVASSAATP